MICYAIKGTEIIIVTGACMFGLSTMLDIWGGGGGGGGGQPHFTSFGQPKMAKSG